MFLRNIIILAVFALFMVPSLSVAQDAAGGNGDLAKAQTKAMQEKVSSLMKTLDVAEVQHFMTMYANYNLYSMVKAVGDDVGSAVDDCAQNNKDMSGDLHRRFSEWEDTVGSAMKDTNDNIQNMALAQDYVPQSELKILFALVDEVRAVNSSRFETTPVTTKEACEFMMSKMDETETSMSGLLKATLSSYPDLQKKNQK